jgi:hypothetical protein
MEHNLAKIVIIVLSLRAVSLALVFLIKDLALLGGLIYAFTLVLYPILFICVCVAFLVYSPLGFLLKVPILFVTLVFFLNSTGGEGIASYIPLLFEQPFFYHKDSAFKLLFEIIAFGIPVALLFLKNSQFILNFNRSWLLFIFMCSLALILFYFSLNKRYLHSHYQLITSNPKGKERVCYLLFSRFRPGYFVSWSNAFCVSPKSSYQWFGNEISYDSEKNELFLRMNFSKAIQGINDVDFYQPGFHLDILKKIQDDFPSLLVSAGDSLNEYNVYLITKVGDKYDSAVIDLLNGSWLKVSRVYNLQIFQLRNLGKMSSSEKNINSTQSNDDEWLSAEMQKANDQFLQDNDSIKLEQKIDSILLEYKKRLDKQR